MEPESERTAPEPGVSEVAVQPRELNSPPPEEPEKPYRGLKWIFVGPQGLRTGWSLPLFVALFLLFTNGLAFVFLKLHLISRGAGFNPRQQFFGELFQVIALIAAAAVMALIERRSILDYYLRGPSRIKHFFSGLLIGFAALSLLVGTMTWGGWLRFGPVALHGLRALHFALIWGAVFLLVGCFEEGMMRCYFQFTLARGINFWWAAGLIACICGFLLFRHRGNGAAGVYIIALLGLLPCLQLHLRNSTGAGFWQAAWFTSVLFGFGHTANAGETWIGIFAAAFIGFVFCVSIWVTGSVWWAIGCHAAWDWAETYFYGTADSGLVAPGHLLTTTSAGNPLWSGGTTGPEGSLLIIPIVLLILVWLLIVYRRPKPTFITATAVTDPCLAGRP